MHRGTGNYQDDSEIADGGSRMVIVGVEEGGLYLEWRARNSVLPSFNLRPFRDIHC